MSETALRGPYLTFEADPFVDDSSRSVRYESDGLIVLAAGQIVDCGPARPLLRTLPPETVIHHYPGRLILPGFVDTHVHFPQSRMIASYGAQLVDWLNTYTFPTELAFASPERCRTDADFFLDELLRNGTTCATSYSTVFPASVDALFAAAEERGGMRIRTGKMCMDRHAPPGLCDTPERAYTESAELIGRWHGRGRADYVISPRFAPTSTEAQLEAVQALADDYPDLAVQTHLSENLREIAWVRELFPGARNYTEVYDRYGLLRPGSILGHGVHLDADELALLAERGATIAHCPTSNFFLGSGIFDLIRTRQGAHPVAVGIGSDVGAGTSFSLLSTLAEAYKAAQLHDRSISPEQLIYLATAGGADAIGLGERIGRIRPGYDGDLVVLDPAATPLLRARTAQADHLADLLFAMIVLGDDRTVQATYVGGRKWHDRDRVEPPRPPGEGQRREVPQIVADPITRVPS
ncbi:guanine deaminase [Austwickia chelonae]|uniref:Guanine deaminase n=1 Tax=Austwickia chelonae NBRC 105200 TaxID=1184607 RepID=K6UKS1_9MICO|nr:guanine deaminase [Austwickia chelonae]GAB76646.1 guanine deaminase [Austwickia chelonae NBRC 105200]SEW28635.1 guanine deaminase [Austwickia chelonae]